MPSNASGGLAEKIDPTLKSAFWIKVRNIEFIVPPRVFPDNTSHNPLDNQELVVLLQSLSGPNFGFYEFTVLHAAKDDKCLEFKRVGFPTATMKIHKNALQSVEIQPKEVEWKDPPLVSSAHFDEWKTPVVPPSSMRSALIDQLPSLASSGPQALQDNNVPGSLTANQRWSHDELRTQYRQNIEMPNASANPQASTSFHQAEPQPTSGAGEFIDAHPIGLLTCANADAEAHIDLLTSSAFADRATLDNWLSSACQLEVFQGKAAESNPVALSVRKAILLRVLIKLDCQELFGNITQNFEPDLPAYFSQKLNIRIDGSDPIIFYSILGFIALEKDLQSYSLPALGAKLYSQKAEISEGENQHEAKLTYLELFALARHAALATEPRVPGKVYFRNKLREDQLIEIANLPDGWKNLEVIARYQYGIESDLTYLANTCLFPIPEVNLVLMRYGFDDFFPARMLATSRVAYTRLEAIGSYIRTLLNEQLRTLNPPPWNKQENGEPGEHMKHLLMRCEELREHGWSEAMIDYELQAFNFSPQQLMSIFSVDGIQKENALNQHVDWLLMSREALRQRGLNEGQIAEKLGWLSNREMIVYCMRTKEGLEQLTNMREPEENIRQAN